MRKLFYIVCTAALVTTSASSMASNTTSGNIYGFQHLANGVVFFQTDGTRSGPPACQNTIFPNRWVFDATTTAGQAMLATVLTNYALHKPVGVYGTGTCTVSGDNETVAAVTTDNL